MRVLRGKLAVSSIVAVLVVILLLSTLTASLLFLAQVQQSTVPTAVETSERISEKAREVLELVGQPSVSGDTVTFTVRNKGDVAVTVKQAVVRLADGSLQTISLTGPVTLIPLQEETLTVSVPLMVQAAERTVALSLPALIILPTFPAEGVGALGVGDILLASLLTINTAKKQGFRAAFLCSSAIAISLMFLGALQHCSGIKFLPATPPIVFGWLLSTLASRKHG